MDVRESDALDAYRNQRTSACAARQAGVLPERLLFTDALPRTEFGKYRRAAIRNQVIAHPRWAQPAHHWAAGITEAGLRRSNPGSR